MSGRVQSSIEGTGSYPVSGRVQYRGERVIPSVWKSTVQGREGHTQCLEEYSTGERGSYPVSGRVQYRGERVIPLKVIFSKGQSVEKEGITLIRQSNNEILR